jgi:hypothetical protein
MGLKCSPWIVHESGKGTLHGDDDSKVYVDYIVAFLKNDPSHYVH